MINMKDLIKQQNTEIRKQTGMIKEENLNEKRFKLSSNADMEWSGNNIVIMSGNKKVVLNRKELGAILRGAQMHRLAAGYEPKGGNINEVDFGKIKLPSVVNRFLDKFVDSMKGANLNRMKRAAILYKVIDAAGMTPQQLMADIQKIKTAMKND